MEEQEHSEWVHFLVKERQEMLSLVKVLAKGELCSDDMGDDCLYCSLSGSYFYPERDGKEPAHEADCPIVKARAILREMGIPMKLFRLGYEYFHDARFSFGPARWIPFFQTFYALDTSEIDVEKVGKELHGEGTKLRDIHWTLVREV